VTILTIEFRVFQCTMLRCLVISGGLFVGSICHHSKGWIVYPADRCSRLLQESVRN